MRNILITAVAIGLVFISSTSIAVQVCTRSLPPQCHEVSEKDAQAAGMEKVCTRSLPPQCHYVEGVKQGGGFEVSGSIGAGSGAPAGGKGGGGKGGSGKSGGGKGGGGKGGGGGAKPSQGGEEILEDIDELPIEGDLVDETIPDDGDLDGDEIAPDDSDLGGDDASSDEE